MLDYLSTSAKLVLGAIGLFGLGMSGGGGLGLFFFQKVLDKILAYKMALSPTSETFPKWSDPPIEVKFSVYLFNVTNPEGVRDGEKVRLQEVGPYVFRNKYFKNVTNWDDANGLVTYYLQNIYTFKPEISVGDMNEEISFFNIPLLAGTAMSKALLGDDKATLEGIGTMLSDALSEASLVEKRTVAELLFKGHESKTMKALMDLAGDAMPASNVDPDHFALLIDRNNTNLGPFVVNTGAKDMKKFNIFKSVMNMTILKYWKTDACNMINGTDGMMFPPNVQKSQKIYVYSPDMCRSVYFRYEKEEEIMGIPSYRFVLSSRCFEDPRKFRDNRCFCLEDDIEKCPRRGIFSLKPCTGLPVFSSNPHFYDCARRHADQVDGLNPDREKHELYINIHPVTGVIMRAHKVAQINVQLEDFPNMPLLTNMSEALVPLLWIREEAVFDEAMTQEFNQKVIYPLNLGKTVLILASAIGGICIVIATSIVMYYTGKERIRTSSSSTVILHYT